MPRTRNVRFSSLRRPLAGAVFALAAIGLVATAPAAAQYRQVIGNDMSKCRSGSGPAVMVTVDGIRS